MPNRRHKHPKISLVGDFMSMSNTISKIGAVSYIIWACLHLLAAYSVYVLGRSLDSSMVQGRVLQDAWNLLFFSIIAISVAATLNWRNSVWGYWINFATVGIADTDFIFFVLVADAKMEFWHPTAVFWRSSLKSPSRVGNVTLRPFLHFCRPSLSPLNWQAKTVEM